MTKKGLPRLAAPFKIQNLLEPYVDGAGVRSLRSLTSMLETRTVRSSRRRTSNSMKSSLIGFGINIFSQQMLKTLCFASCIGKRKIGIFSQTEVCSLFVERP